MTATLPGDQARFRILYVCVGNVCRSVLAERLTRHGLATRLGGAAELFWTGSAGTDATPGRAMHPYVREVLRARDVGCSGFATRRLSIELVTGSDLVLTATATERDRAISLVPAALRRTFTLREFARLAGSSPVEIRRGDAVGHARAAVAAVHGRRGRMPYVDPDDDDVPDPEPTRAAFDECAVHIAAALEPVLAVLCPRLAPLDLRAGRV
jgi:protein-tyrosine phosphatase